MSPHRTRLLLGLAALAMTALAGHALGQSSTFTYQGNLTVSGATYTGNADLRFRLYDAVTGGTQLGPQVELLTQPVANGQFTAGLDFGAVFAGQDCWLEIDVRAEGEGGYVTLWPRQKITVAPYAMYAFKAPEPVLPPPMYNPLQVALKRWQPITQSGAWVNVRRPAAMAFDGTNIWVSSYSYQELTKIRAADLAVLGVFPMPAGYGMHGMAFDGAYLWCTHLWGGLLSKVRASDGAVVGQYNVGEMPFQIMFDGDNMWVTLRSGYVKRIRAYDFVETGAYPFGADDPPWGIAFDGTSVWVVFDQQDVVRRIRRSDGGVLASVRVGTNPQELAFDGTYVWVGNYGDSTVSKVRASDATLVGTFPLGHPPMQLAFDGTDIWIAGGDSTLTKIRTSDGSPLGTWPVHSAPAWGSMAFDGANMWMACGEADLVRKH